MRTFPWVVVLAAFSLAACDKPAPTVEEVRPVRTQTVQRQMLSDLPTQVGEIRPHFESDLGFKIAGRIESRLSLLGSVVRKGDVIAHLDERDQRNQLLAALADVRSAEAGFTRTDAEERRQRQLRRDGWSTQAAYDAALQARDTSAATLAAAKARVQLAHDQLGYAWLRAPEDGVVTALGAEAGQVVAAGQMVIRLARLDRKDAVFSIAESAMARIEGERQVDVWLLDNPDIRTSGRITEVAPSADPVTRTYTIKVALPDAPAAMRLGMTAVGRIQAGAHPVVALPAAALFQEGGKPAVWIVGRESMTVSLVKVSLIQVDPDRVLLDGGPGGIPDGALVVTAGIQKLHPGQKVRLMAEAAEDGSAPAGGSTGGTR